MQEYKRDNSKEDQGGTYYLTKYKILIETRMISKVPKNKSMKYHKKGSPACLGTWLYWKVNQGVDYLSNGNKIIDSP